MKNQILILLFVAAAGVSSYAQCDKKIILSAGATEYFNAADELQRTVEEQTVIEYDSKTITVTPNGRAMEGTVNSITCEWKTPFKEGKTVIKAVIPNPRGESMNATITIEGKDGKVTLLFEAAESPNRKIRITPDKFEEKKL
jgi:hypothetical protein